jgi:hypothetical protein
MILESLVIDPFNPFLRCCPYCGRKFIADQMSRKFCVEFNGIFVYCKDHFHKPRIHEKLILRNQVVTFLQEIEMPGPANNHKEAHEMLHWYLECAFDNVSSEFAIGGALQGWVSSTAAQTQLGSYTNIPIVFYQNNTEGMRLTSTGLGIGTSSPSDLLSVKGDGIVTGSGWNEIAYFRNSAQSKGLNIGYNASANNATLISQSGGSASGFEFWGYTGSAWAQRATIDGSGNLGLGVTPSASWNTTFASSTICSVIVSSLAFFPFALDFLGLLVFFKASRLISLTSFSKVASSVSISSMIDSIES